jgi:hypothetical protein
MRATSFALVVLALLAGCARAHLTDSYGLATRGTFGMQQVKAAKPPPPPNMALDTQEAQVIGKSYVKSLSGKTGAAEPEQMLYVAPQGGGAATRLSPSVPKE